MSPILDETELSRRALLPAGVRDSLPPDAAHEAAVVEALVACCTARGYERVKPPLVEFEDSLFAGPGAAMTHRSFRLMDPVSQRMMGVRADMTVQIARIASTRLSNAPRPLRLCYAGEVLRVTGTPLTPERELVQVGAELIGSDAVSADIESVVMALDALMGVGVPRLSVDITSPRLVPTLIEAGTEPGPRLAALRAAIDRKETAEVARLGGTAADTLVRLMAAAGRWESGVAALRALELPAPAVELVERLAAVASAVAEAVPSVEVTIDPVENRGFEYYTGTGFSLFSRGVRAELGRGGHYRTDGEASEGSAGFTLYMESVIRALPDPAAPRRVFLPHGTPRGRGIALRAEGWTTVRGLEPAADSAGEARRLGCTHILGDGGPVAVVTEGPEA